MAVVAGAAPVDDRWELFDLLTNSGMDSMDAYAEAFGKDPERVRRDEAMRKLRADGYRGRSFDELAREAFREVIAGEVRRAEQACNGYLVRWVRGCAPPAPVELWRNPDWYAEKWSTDELKAWWDEHGRVTLVQYKHWLVWGTSGGSAGGGDWLR